MTTRSAYHSETAAAFLLKARAYLDGGDLLQASEKGWGAAARMVKAVAEERGWSHALESDLFVAVNRVAAELNDAQLRRLFLSVSALHQNFYEGWFSEEMVADALGDVEEFARRLDGATA